MSQAPPVKNRKRKKSGIPTWKIVLSIAVIMIVLHAMIAGSIASVSRASNGMTEIMRTYSEYMSDVTSLQEGASRLSETATSFLLCPELPNGELNVGPLQAYAQELQQDRRGTDIQRRFDAREIDAEIRAKIDSAVGETQTMIRIQLHAIALIFSVPGYTLPESPAIQALPLPALSEEESAPASKEEALHRVIDLIAGKEYSEAKRDLSQSASEVNEAFGQQMQLATVDQHKSITVARTVLFSATVAVVVTLLIAFFLLVRLLVVPLRTFVRNIDEGTKLSDRQGLAEVQLVAHSYNAMMKRRNALEEVLRSAAEIDTLTNLPNRYHMEQYFLQEDEEGTSAVLFLFDVNFLKDTNDKEGHSAGDALLQRAAKCIYVSFTAFPEAKCFRYGGDEFVAILKNCNEEDVKSILGRFAEEQKNFEVSIAVGYAYSPDVSKLPVKELFDKADERMYICKKEMHGERKDN